MKKILIVLTLSLILIMAQVVLPSTQIKFHLNGKEIDLTGDNIVIKSNNFNVDESGDITCKYATITGGKINLQDNGGTDAFRVIKDNDYHTMSYVTSNVIAINNNNDHVELSIHNYPSLSIYRENVSSTNITYERITTPNLQITNEGYVMHGTTNQHYYRCNWENSKLQFFVDETNVGTLSDKRLKTEIQDVNEKFIKAIKEIEIKQFKIANRNGLISFGILAQDLIEIFEKYNISPFDYEIVQKTKYRLDDDTIYYTIDYEQYLILKAKVQELEIKQLQEKDKQKDEIIQDLIKRIEALEKGAKNE